MHRVLDGSVDEIPRTLQGGDLTRKSIVHVAKLVIFHERDPADAEHNQTEKDGQRSGYDSTYYFVFFNPFHVFFSLIV